jgi:hypothetical protein
VEVFVEWAVAVSVVPCSVPPVLPAAVVPDTLDVIDW